jgi:hypothetical protein
MELLTEFCSFCNSEMDFATAGDAITVVKPSDNTSEPAIVFFKLIRVLRSL